MACFHYKWSKIIQIDCAIVILIVITVLGIISINRGEIRNGILIMLAGYVLLIPFYINARLLVSRICVGADGAKWITFGFTWKTIPWSAVKKIRRLKSYNVFARRELNTYVIDLRLSNTLYILPNGPIVFDETIEKLDDLLSLINKYAIEHHINIVACINKRAEPLDRL